MVVLLCGCVFMGSCCYVVVLLCGCVVMGLCCYGVVLVYGCVSIRLCWYVVVFLLWGNVVAMWLFPNNRLQMRTATMRK